MDIKARVMEFDSSLRKASVATVSETPTSEKSTSSFSSLWRRNHSAIRSCCGGRGLGKAGEQLPEVEGATLIPILQIRMDELPFVPEPLSETAYLIVFMDPDEPPIDGGYGGEYEVREYRSLKGLAPLPSHARGLPTHAITWGLVEDDALGADSAADRVGLGYRDVGHSSEEREKFGQHYRERFETKSGIKVGGYPYELQGQVYGQESFVLQIDGIYVPGYELFDSGIALLFKNEREEGSYWDIQVESC